MKKSKCEKMSKAQKAAEKNASQFFDPSQQINHGLMVQSFVCGAEAFLRYARKNGFDVFDSGFVVRVLDLEEWVKGEK